MKFVIQGRKDSVKDILQVFAEEAVVVKEEELESIKSVKRKERKEKESVKQKEREGDLNKYYVLNHNINYSGLYKTYKY